jgi:hypothetical protein
MLFLAVVGGLSACKSESVDAVLARRRPGVEATFRAISTHAEAIRAAEPVAQPTLEPLEPPLSLSSTAAFIHEEDLAAPGEASTIAVRSLDSQTLLHCGALLTRGTFYRPLDSRVSVTKADRALWQCETLRYLLVIRPRTWLAPRADEATRTFTPGSLKGDVLVFDLKAGKVVGGFPFWVLNERRLDVPAGEGQTDRLLRNLESLLYLQLRQSLESLAPGAVPPSPL